MPSSRGWARLGGAGNISWDWPPCWLLPVRGLWSGGGTLLLLLLSLMYRKAIYIMRGNAVGCLQCSRCRMLLRLR